MDGLAEVIATALKGTAGVATAEVQSDNMVFVTKEDGNGYTVFITQHKATQPAGTEG